jgi:hypothetical protein
MDVYSSTDSEIVLVHVLVDRAIAVDEFFLHTSELSEMLQLEFVPLLLHLLGNQLQVSIVLVDQSLASLVNTLDASETPLEHLLCLHQFHLALLRTPVLLILQLPELPSQ